MFRPVIRASSRRVLAPKTFLRRDHHAYGPEEHLFNKTTITWALVGSGFIGLIVWDAFLAPRAPGFNKSVIGNWLIPDFDKKAQEEAYLHKVDVASKQRDMNVLLFSTRNDNSNVEENYSAMPVPSASARGVAPGSLLDLDKIDERRPRTKYLADKTSASEEQQQ